MINWDYSDPVNWSHLSAHHSLCMNTYNYGNSVLHCCWKNIHLNLGHMAHIYVIDSERPKEVIMIKTESLTSISSFRKYCPYMHIQSKVLSKWSDAMKLSCQSTISQPRHSPPPQKQNPLFLDFPLFILEHYHGKRFELRIKLKIPTSGLNFILSH